MIINNNTIGKEDQGQDPDHIQKEEVGIEVEADIVQEATHAAKADPVVL